MENGQEQINNKTGRNVAKFAGCFIGTCLLSAALFLLWCGISYSMRLSVELIRVGITAWYALSGLIGGKILRACKCGAIPFCAVMLGRAERIPEEERLIREILKRNLNDFFPWESRVRKRRIARNKRLIPWM